MKINYTKSLIRILITYVLALQSFSSIAEPIQNTLKIATFDVDATPPI